MTKVELLNALAAFTEQVTGDLLSPISGHQPGQPPELRAAGVYRMRLPDGGAAKKKAPYVLHQILTGKDAQEAGQRPESVATVRSIFCVYHPNEQEGGLALLNLMERFRVAVLERKTLRDGMFWLDTYAPLESLVYPDDSAPYFGGEMMSVWHLPPVTRLDVDGMLRGWPAIDPALRYADQKGFDTNDEETH